MSNATLDNSGAFLSLNTRAGIDLLFQLGVDSPQGQPVDLTGYFVDARLDDGVTVHTLDTTLAFDTISVHIPASLTAVLPATNNRYSVEVVSPDNIRSSLVYGPVTVEEAFP